MLDTITAMCHHCGAPFDQDRKPGFNEVCASCGKDIHVCRACAFYKPGAYRDCAETVEQTILDKDKRNHCDWFALAKEYLRASGGAHKEQAAAQAARRNFEGLFGS